MVGIIVTQEDVFHSDSPFIAMGIFKDDIDSFTLDQFNNEAENLKKDVISKGEFKGNFGDACLLHINNHKAVTKIFLVGLGNKKDFTHESARLLAGKVVLKVKELGSRGFSLALVNELSNEFMSSLVEGLKLADYSFNKYKTDKIKNYQNEVESAYIITSDDNEGLEKIARQASIISDAVNFSRDLGNLPPNDCSPSDLARFAAEAGNLPNVNVSVIEYDDLRSRELNGIIAVGGGSDHLPKLIIMEYFGTKDKEVRCLLVGKAVTFDTGGISLKPSEKMDEMKFDKCGGCNVIAIIKAIAQLCLPINVVGIIPAVENMPSGSSYRPGDIIKMYNGKTVEVGNTDAEGRIILADALSYGVKTYSPAAIIDMATLTGAAIIALGSNVAALLGNDPKLVDKLIHAANQSGEKLWQLPIFEEHEEQLKSSIADMKNIGGRSAGAITAAVFLSNFVDNTPWVHLDIAGTAWFQEGSSEKSYIPKGATGFGIRTIIRLLMEMSTLQA
ncbi:MAG TPA: leucyl aminopeptidase [Nitrososphaeraceae archaeon]|nr:leucyl aminopeptidase [Nitrososphaeraceae archaeon]